MPTDYEDFERMFLEIGGTEMYRSDGELAFGIARSLDRIEQTKPALLESLYEAAAKGGLVPPQEGLN